MSTGNWAEISPDGAYRYGLGRRWGDGPVLGWIMLNPSAADAVTDDQTIRQVTAFSKREGYGAAWVANLFALRTPSPDVLRGHRADRAGPLADIWLRTMLAAVPEVVLAWGAHGGERWAEPRRYEVTDLVAEYPVTVSVLGWTRNKQPKHPCRLAHATPLEALP